MLRLCRERSRPYPGRSAGHAAAYGRQRLPWQHVRVIGQRSAEAIVGVGRRCHVPGLLGNEPRKNAGGLTPLKGQT